jgi:hypothetical protein
MLKNLLYNLMLSNKTNDLHFSTAFRAKEWVDYVYFFDTFIKFIYPKVYILRYQWQYLQPYLYIGTSSGITVVVHFNRQTNNSNYNNKL